MSSSLLEWIKVLGPVIVSWPLVVIIIIFIFRSRFIALINKFIETPESSAEIGPLRIQIGKSPITPLDELSLSDDGFELLDIGECIGEIRDTGQEGTTVAFALMYAMQASIKLKYNEIVKLSPRSIYIAAQKYDEWSNQQHDGTSLIGALIGIQKDGAYLEEDWPYEKKDIKSKNQLKKYYIKNYKKIIDIDEIINNLKLNKPVVASIKVTKDFFKPATDGKVIIRSFSESKHIGDKAICIIAYDEKQAEFKFANDWGPSWGYQGFGIIRNSDLASIFNEAFVFEI